jgi:hypothetical protein
MIRRKQMLVERWRTDPRTDPFMRVNAFAKIFRLPWVTVTYRSLLYRHV